MTPSDIARAAERLAEVRREGRLLDRLPADARPGNVAEGYLVQDAFCKMWGDTVAGWKIGATAKALMARFGVTEPFSGPFFAGDVVTSPARPLAARNPYLCLEAEIAFRFARPLAPRTKPYARSEVVEAVGAALPAFELVGPRFSRILFDAVPSLIADCGLNAGMVLGPERADWRGLDLINQPVRFTVDGKARAEGTGAAVLGDPVAVLEWTANHLSARGITLEAGQIVTTGATSGLLFIEPGEVGAADYGPLGAIELAFTGPRSAQLAVRP
jgi:2-keto-4-pentenoate hydratase